MTRRRRRHYDRTRRAAEGGAGRDRPRPHHGLVSAPLPVVCGGGRGARPDADLRPPGRARGCRRRAHRLHGAGRRGRRDPDFRTFRPLRAGRVPGGGGGPGADPVGRNRHQQQLPDRRGAQLGGYGCGLSRGRDRHRRSGRDQGDPAGSGRRSARGRAVSQRGADAAPARRRCHRALLQLRPRPCARAVFPGDGIHRGHHAFGSHGALGAVAACRRRGADPQAGPGPVAGACPGRDPS